MQVEPVGLFQPRAEHHRTAHWRVQELRGLRDQVQVGVLRQEPVQQGGQKPRRALVREEEDAPAAEPEP